MFAWPELAIATSDRMIQTDNLLDRALTLEDLQLKPVLTFSRTSSPHAHVRALFAARAIEPRVCSVPSVESIIQLVSDGYGVAAIPPIFVRKQLEQAAPRGFPPRGAPRTSLCFD